MSDAIDYAAELVRSRRAQGLDVDVPQHVRDAVAALLSTVDEEGADHARAS